MTVGFVSSGIPLSHSVFTPRISVCTQRKCAYLSSRRAARMMVGEAPTAEEGSIPSENGADTSTMVDIPQNEIIEENTAVSEDSVDNITTMESSDDDIEDDGTFEECSPPQPYLNQIAIKEAQEKFKRHDTDSGSPEFQIATLTTKISYLTNHLRTHPKDFSTTRGLLKMVSTRRRLLKYLKKEDVSRFDAIIEGLNIRVSQQLKSL